MKNLAALFVLAGLVPAQVASEVGKSTPEQDLARASNAFGCDLHRALMSREGNLFYSPYSISVALGMTKRGASGATEGEMAKVLHSAGVKIAAFAALDKALAPNTVTDYSGRNRRSIAAYELHVANALWGHVGMKFEEPFTKSMGEDFDAPLMRVDFTKTEAARKRINDWVAQHTKDRIQDIVPPGLPTADCRLALGNAIYFKAQWQNPFKERSTKPGDFTTAAGKTVEASMMARSGRMGYAETEELQMLELPYRGNSMAMVVFLPKKQDGLPALEKKLDGATLDSLCSQFKSRAVALKLPKFEFTLPLRLDETLKDMGMRIPFTLLASFSKMTKEDRLYIGAVLHKAFIAVDEKGTEAAAATIVLMRRGGRPRPQTPVAFTADHPFLFAIRHRKTGCVLFMGRITDPTVAK